MDVTEVLHLLVSSGGLAGSDLEGCSDDEVSDIEKQIGCSLPSAYRSYLKMAGHEANGFLAESEIRYRNLPSIAEALDGLGETGCPWTPGQKDFVFMMHQGYEFTFFRLGEGEDPPIYQYVEGWTGPKLAWPSFTQFLFEMSQSYLAYLDKI